MDDLRTPSTLSVILGYSKLNKTNWMWCWLFWGGLWHWLHMLLGNFYGFRVNVFPPQMRLNERKQNTYLELWQINATFTANTRLWCVSFVLCNHVNNHCVSASVNTSGHKTSAEAWSVHLFPANQLFKNTLKGRHSKLTDILNTTHVYHPGFNCKK